jgi:carboxyl-terminal PDZ ligand of neuronal nitric oxide synthase protein
VHLLREHLQHQTQQTKQTLAQLILVREQLLTETNARIEAQVRALSQQLYAIERIKNNFTTPNVNPTLILSQARTQQLLQQNRELLEHIASLSGLNESDRTGLTSANIGMAPQVC